MRQLIAPKRRAVELDTAVKRLAIDQFRPREVAELQRDRARDIDLHLVGLALDQQSAAARVAKVEHKIDVDGRGTRIGLAVDDDDLAEELELVQQIEQRAIARDMLMLALHVLGGLRVADSTVGAAAGPALLVARLHLLEGLERPRTHPFLLAKPVDMRIILGRQREGAPVLGVRCTGRQIGLRFDKRHQGGVEGDHHPILVAALVWRIELTNIDPGPVARPLEERA